MTLKNRTNQSTSKGFGFNKSGNLFPTSTNIVFQDATQGAPSELPEILGNAQNFLTTSVADSTRDMYVRDWRDWKGFV